MLVVVSESEIEANGKRFPFTEDGVKQALESLGCNPNHLVPLWKAVLTVLIVGHFRLRSVSPTDLVETGQC